MVGAGGEAGDVVCAFRLRNVSRRESMERRCESGAVSLHDGVALRRPQVRRE